MPGTWGGGRVPPAARDQSDMGSLWGPLCSRRIWVGRQADNVLYVQDTCPHKDVTPHLAGASSAPGMKPQEEMALVRPWRPLERGPTPSLQPPSNCPQQAGPHDHTPNLQARCHFHLEHPSHLSHLVALTVYGNLTQVLPPPGSPP